MEKRSRFHAATGLQIFQCAHGIRPFLRRFHMAEESLFLCTIERIKAPLVGKEVSVHGGEGNVHEDCSMLPERWE